MNYPYGPAAFICVVLVVALIGGLAYYEHSLPVINSVYGSKHWRTP